jgi:hypothetical protein
MELDMPKYNKNVHSKVGFGQHKYKKGINKEQQAMLAENMSIAEDDLVYGYDEYRVEPKVGVGSYSEEDDQYVEEDVTEDSGNDDSEYPVEVTHAHGFFAKTTEKVTHQEPSQEAITSPSVSVGK